MARRFGATWWGRAWIDALEGRARLDPNRLPRGRTYARQGRVADDLGIEPGLISADVHGRRRYPYRVAIRVRTFSDEEWVAVFAAIAGRAAHAAALFDGELDPAVVDDARSAGTELLPDAGELQPRCSCPDWADPCKHSAAVCYLVADVLDADPFALFLLRGRDRAAVLAGVRARRADDAGPSATPQTLSGSRRERGEVASEVWKKWGETQPESIQATGSIRSRPGSPAPPATDPPPGTSVTTDSLMAVARDAARRAWLMMTNEGDSSLDLDETDDLARRAADALGTPAFGELARSAGGSHRDLTRLALGWRHGGRGGTAIVREKAWRPDRRVIEQAAASLGELGVEASRLRVGADRINLDQRVLLRYGRDRLWYRLEKQANRWELAAAPADDPVDLLTDSDLEVGEALDG